MLGRKHRSYLLNKNYSKSLDRIIDLIAESLSHKDQSYFNHHNKILDLIIQFKSEGLTIVYVLYKHLQALINSYVLKRYV